MQNQILRNSGWVVLLVLFTTLASQAQVKVGDSPTTLNSSAVLEMQSTSTKRGMLLPRVELLTTTDWGLNGPVGNKVNGMVVYNTKSDISGSAEYPAAGVGTYTFDGTGWVFSDVLKGGSTGQVLSKTASGLAWGTPASGVVTYFVAGVTSGTGMIVTATGTGVTYTVNPTAQTVTVSVPAGVRLLSFRSIETLTSTGVNASGSILKYVIQTDAADNMNTSFLNATIPQVQFFNYAANPKNLTSRAIRFDSATDNKLTVSITQMDTFSQYLFVFNF